MSGARIKMLARREKGVGLMVKDVGVVEEVLLLQKKLPAQEKRFCADLVCGLEMAGWSVQGETGKRVDTTELREKVRETMSV